MRGKPPCANSAPYAVQIAMPFVQRKSGTETWPLDDDGLIRSTITAAIKRSPKGRAQIAEELSRLLAIRVTDAMLACFTAGCKRSHRWPAAWDRAFCQVVEDDTLLRCRAEAAGYRVIGGDEIELLELGREWLRQKRAGQQVEMLEKRLQGVEL